MRWQDTETQLFADVRLLGYHLGCNTLGPKVWKCTALTTLQHLHVGSPSVRRHPSSVHQPGHAAVVAVVASSGGVSNVSRSAHRTAPVSTPPANGGRSAGYPSVTYDTNTVPYLVGVAC